MKTDNAEVPKVNKDYWVEKLWRTKLCTSSSWGGVQENTVGISGPALYQFGKYFVLIFSLPEPWQGDDCQSHLAVDTMSNPRRFMTGLTWGKLISNMMNSRMIMPWCIITFLSCSPTQTFIDSPGQCVRQAIDAERMLQSSHYGYVSKMNVCSHCAKPHRIAIRYEELYRLWLKRYW